MSNRILTTLIGMVTVFFLVSCSSPTLEPDVATRLVTTRPMVTLTLPAISTSSSTPTITPSPIPPPAIESSQELATSDPLPDPLPIPTAIPIELPEVKIVSCQDLPISTDDFLKGTGYLLYYTQDILGVGAISLNDLSQRRLFEGLGSPAYGVELSPDRNLLSFHRYGEDLLLLNLLTGMTTRIPFNKTWTLASPNWSQDGRIIAHTTGDAPLEFYFLDPLTLVVAGKEDPSGWPEVSYTTIHHLPGSGFIAVDPSEIFTVYTERGTPPDYAMNFVLRNVQDGSEHWRNADVGYEYYVEPRWSEDGSQVLLVLPETDNRVYTLILSLTPEGKETEIARLTQLPGVGNDYEVRYLEWSPNQRFIHFGLFETIEMGPGYILDTDTKTVYEICEPNFVQGWWLPNEEGGHLMYLADEKNGERTLNVLDVVTWQHQEVLVTDANFDKQNVIGWTPIETP